MNNFTEFFISFNHVCSREQTQIAKVDWNDLNPLSHPADREIFSQKTFISICCMLLTVSHIYTHVHTHTSVFLQCYYCLYFYSLIFKMFLLVFLKRYLCFYNPFWNYLIGIEKFLKSFPNCYLCIFILLFSQDSNYVCVFMLWVSSNFYIAPWFSSLYFHEIVYEIQSYLIN